MAVLQDRGRIALASAVAALPIYLAWGRGLPVWDAKPEPEPTTAEALVDEIGRRRVTSVQFVLPAADGEIELPDESRYAVTEAPSKWLLLRFVFDYGDAAGETVRELGVFLGGTFAAGLPAGQRYFPKAQVLMPGELYTMERFKGWERNANTRQVQEVVLPF